MNALQVMDSHRKEVIQVSTQKNDIKGSVSFYDSFTKDRTPPSL